MSQLFLRRPNLEALPRTNTPANLTLREFRGGDQQRLAALLASAFDDPVWSPQRVESELIQAADVVKTFLVEDVGNQCITATASARINPERYGSSGYVHWVAVDSRYRGKSLGTIVTAAVLCHFKELGLMDAVLETDDFRLAAIKTYLGIGFVPEYVDPAHLPRWSSAFRSLLAARTIPAEPG